MGIITIYLYSEKQGLGVPDISPIILWTRHIIPHEVRDLLLLLQIWIMCIL